MLAKIFAPRKTGGRHKYELKRHLDVIVVAWLFVLSVRAASIRHTRLHKILLVVHKLTLKVLVFHIKESDGRIKHYSHVIPDHPEVGIKGSF